MPNGANGISRLSRSELSNVFRHQERCTVSPVTVTEQLVGFFVIDNPLRLGIKAEASAEPVRCIRQMNESGGNVAFFNRGREILFFTATNAVDKVGKVVASSMCARSGLLVMT